MSFQMMNPVGCRVLVLLTLSGAVCWATPDGRTPGLVIEAIEAPRGGVPTCDVSALGKRVWLAWLRLSRPRSLDLPKLAQLSVDQQSSIWQEWTIPVTIVVRSCPDARLQNGRYWCDADQEQALVRQSSGALLVDIAALDAATEGIHLDPADIRLADCSRHSYTLRMRFERPHDRKAPITELLRMLESDWDPAFRRGAAATLGDLGHEAAAAAIGALEQAARVDADASVRSEASHALDRLRQK
jgi:HEAT repeat protein